MRAIFRLGLSPRRLFQEIFRRIVFRMVKTAFSIRYYHFDVGLQKMKSQCAPQSRNFENLYEGSLLSRERERASNHWAIVVLWNPDGNVEPGIRSLLDVLNTQGIRTFVVANSKLSEEQAKHFQENTAFYAERKNVGYDFGAYKDAYQHLLETDRITGRIGFFNDSVFYLTKGLEGFVSKFFSRDEDLIAATESSQISRHVQSYAFVLSPSLATGERVKAFWRNYVPISNRKYAIRHGELALSRVVEEAARSKYVLFSSDRLRTEVRVKLKEHQLVIPDIKCIPVSCQILLDGEFVEARSVLTTFLRKSATDTGNEPVDLVCRVIDSMSPIHAGAWAFVEYLSSPLVKKDLVYRHVFALEDIPVLIGKNTTPEELSAIMTAFRARGDAHSYGIKDKILHELGLTANRVGSR